MSCLLWILTGAGNVGRTQCECSQIKADKRKGGVFIPTPSVYLQVLCCFQGDIAMVLIKTSLVQKQHDKIFLLTADRCHYGTRVTGDAGEDGDM